MDKNQNKVEIPRVMKAVEKGVVSQVSQEDWNVVRGAIFKISDSSKFAHLFSKESRSYK